MKDSEKHRYPTLTPENKELADNMADTMIGCVIRGRNSFLYTSNEIVSLNRQWKDQSKYEIFHDKYCFLSNLGTLVKCFRILVNNSETLNSSPDFLSIV